MDRKQVEYLVKLRDALQMAADVTNEYLESLASNEARSHVDEKVFAVLKFEQQQGVKLGNYETASETNNPADQWKAAYEELSKASATIKDRYHGKDYQFSYWLYGEGKIYRQILRKGEEPSATSSKSQV